MTIKAVIFDLDGTITQPFFDFDLIREEMGLEKNSGPVLETMLKMTPQQRKEAESILTVYENRAVAESKLNPGATETLQQLRHQGIHVGILTRNKRKNAVAVAEKHNLQFDFIVDREDGPAKPDAFGVLRICEHFDVEPRQTLLVGDYLFDLLCAKAAGAGAVLLANTEKSRDFVEHADFTIERIDQILQIVEENNSTKTSDTMEAE
jgi:HAD superfamily hydrolase (TIGR01509 family)